LHHVRTCRKKKNQINQNYFKKIIHNSTFLSSPADKLRNLPEADLSKNCENETEDLIDKLSEIE